MKVNEYYYLRRYEIQQKMFIRTTLDNRTVGSRRVKSECRQVGGLAKKIQVASNTSWEHAHCELTATAFQPGKCLWILFTEAVLKTNVTVVSLSKINLCGRQNVTLTLRRQKKTTQKWHSVMRLILRSPTKLYVYTGGGGSREFGSHRNGSERIQIF